MQATSEHNRVRRGDILPLSIEKLIYGGTGLSHKGSMVCFVEQVIPGEQVHVQVDEVKKQYVHAYPIAITSPSVFRRQPRCRYFTQCGGCHWQHITYIHQLYWKTEIVKECLQRIAGIARTKVSQAIGSPSQWHYRIKATLKLSSHPEPAIGYYQRKTHHVVPIHSCKVLAPSINHAVRTCWHIMKKQHDFFNGVSEIVFLSTTGNRRVVMSFIRENALKPEVYLCETSVHTGENNSTVFFQANEKIFRKHFHEKVFGVVFQRDARIFCQVNPPQNATIIKLVLGFFGNLENKRILDIYCGCGNFSLLLAKQGASVTGIDADAIAIHLAKQNARENRIKGCTFFCSDVNQVDPQQLQPAYNGMLVNPPRHGCSHKAIAIAEYFSPELIIYVSCNPTTLARDTRRLLLLGYCIDTIQPVDMFPQTFHVETVVKFSKKA